MKNIKKRYSKLTAEQINQLMKNHCQSDDWYRIEVTDDFNPDLVTDTIFKGDVKIGSFGGDIDSDDGIVRTSSINNAKLQNVTVGDDCYISNVNGWLANLTIGDKVIIENVGTISCAGESTFGNGYEIDVLNEGGGRELKISNRTSAQIAYLTVMYRDKEKLITKLDKFVDNYAASLKSNLALIGDNVQIFNCDKIQDVAIGDFTKLSGVRFLRNGTINSSFEAHTVIENGVIMENFIIQMGAKITNGVMVDGAIVGEATKIGKQFSVENSVLFANSEGFHSEACSLFAGPYSVTHHRSTLLIAAMVSFYNAGSGTNQSNHMYKLGPLHQGIMERGSKTGSFSYLLWPSRVGAFSVVMGKNTINFDTSIFPFSYINEEDGQPTLVPGMNFFTVGTLRDGEKWPNRDRRKNTDKLDLLIFDVLSPYTAQKMIVGEKLLLKLSEETDRSQKFVKYNGARIKRLLLKTCSRYYKLALQKYFGDLVLRRFEEKNPGNLRELFIHDENGVVNGGEWIDMSGLLCSGTRVDSLIQDVKEGQIYNLDSLQKDLKSIHESYRNDEWNWFLETYQEIYGRDIAALSGEEAITFFTDWKTASQKLLKMVTADAGKEFDNIAKIGFGIDGNKEEDFKALRGDLENNAFIKSLEQESIEVENKFEQIKTKIKKNKRGKL